MMMKKIVMLVMLMRRRRWYCWEFAGHGLSQYIHTSLPPFYTELSPQKQIQIQIQIKGHGLILSNLNSTQISKYNLERELLKCFIQLVDIARLVLVLVGRLVVWVKYYEQNHQVKIGWWLWTEVRQKGDSDTPSCLTFLHCLRISPQISSQIIQLI